MVHYNDIKEGQTVKCYNQHICKVVEKTQAKSGTYHLHLIYPNPLMMEINVMLQSDDGNFPELSL